MRFEYIKHSQVNDELLSKIIALKNIHWHYTFEEHLNWMARNLKSDDVHVLMYEDDILVAYMNLVEVNIIIDHKKNTFLGIGNVCSRKKGFGHGGLLLQQVSDYIFSKNKIGILLCKDSLIDFYINKDWKLVDKNNVKADFNLLNTMILDFNNQLKDKSIFIKNEF